MGEQQKNSVSVLRLLSHAEFLKKLEEGEGRINHLREEEDKDAGQSVLTR
jgi:hypothetical protein